MEKLALFDRLLRLNAEVYENIRRHLRVGMTERHLEELVRKTYEQANIAGLEFTGDLITGERCGDIGGMAGERVICIGDTLIADLLVQADGVACDTTRTFFFGQPSEEQRKAYEAVCVVLQEGAAFLRSGVEAQQVYHHVSGLLEGRGYAPLPHHAGHGVGKSWYEPPYLEAGQTDCLKAGMLLALEPGVYVRGQYGIRVENNYLLTEQGAENRFDYPLELDYFILEG